MDGIIGREAEINILKEALNSRSPELIAVHGRRRVGKTFLIRNYYSKYIKFEFSGLHNGKLHSQLENFHLQTTNI